MIENGKLIFKRGEIYFVNEVRADHSTEHIVRPFIIVSNDKNNEFSDTLLCVPLTTNAHHAYLPTQARIMCGKNVSYAKCEHITTVPKKNVAGYVGKANKFEMLYIDKCLQISLFGGV